MTLRGIGIVLMVFMASTVSAQWAGMPWGGQQQRYAPPQSSWGQMMPWGGQQQTYLPQRSMSPWDGTMMPWGQQQSYAPQPATQPFSGMMPWGNQPQRPQQRSSAFGGMMPWGQQPVQQSRQQNMWMPGMEEGIRSMMAPGKIMAEEATPGMLMKPTWSR